MSTLIAVVVKGGVARFGEVALPERTVGATLGELEYRLPGEMGDWHLSPPGKAVLVTVLGGEWTIEMMHGETRTFVSYETVCIQDADAEELAGVVQGHRSQNSGSDPLFLQKTILDGLLEVV